MPIGSGTVYNAGDLIVSQVSSSGTSFLETKITAATSSLIYFDSTARINSASLNSITVGTSSYLSASGAVVGNLTASSVYVNNGPVTISGSSAFVKMLPTNAVIPTTETAGYIYMSGSTNDIYFTQQNGSHRSTTCLAWLEGNLYTGLLNGGVLTSTLGSNTFNISSGEGIIVDLNASTASVPNPSVTSVSWPNYTNQPLLYSGSARITYVGIGNTGQIIQQTNPWGSSNIDQWDEQIFLGVVLHLSGSVSTGVFNSPQISYGVPQKTDDFLRAFGPLKISGHTLQASGSSPTLSIKKSGGVAYREGANYVINPNHPSTVTENDINISKIYRYYISGSTPVIDTGVANAGYTSIDNTKYVNTSTGQLTTVTTGSWSIQRVFWVPNSPTNAFIVYYGNAIYSTLIDAVNAKDSEPFTEAPNTATNSIFVGWIIIEGGSGKDLLNATHGTIIQGGLFRNVGGVGSSGTIPVSTTLAGLSDVEFSGLLDGDLLTYNGGQWNNSKTLRGNYVISGSLNVQSPITGNLIGTSSWSTNALTASVLATNGNAFLQGGNSFGTTATLGTNDASALIFETSGSGRVTIDTNGNVGVGTTNPLTKLHITDVSVNPASTAISTQSKLVIAGLNGAVDLLSQDDNTTVSNVIGMGRYNASTGDLIHKFGIATWANTGSVGSNTGDRLGFHYGTSTNPYASTELMTIKTNGNVGIGSNNPSIKLDVVAPAIGLSNQPGIISRFTQDVDGRALIRVVNSNTSGQAAATHAGISFVAYSNVSVQPYTSSHEAQIMLGGTGTGTSDLKFIAPQGMTFWTSASNVIMTSSSYANYGRQAIAITPAGYVGIGTASPTALLELSNSLATTLINVKGVNGNGIFYVSGSGNVGIGTTVPSQKLQVEGRILSTGLYAFNSSSNNPYIAVGENINANSFGFMGWVSQSNNLTIGHSVGQTAGSTAPNGSVNINKYGHVGIGTTVSSTWSNVVNGTNRGLIQLYGSSDGILVLENSNSSAYIQKYLNNLYINNGVGFITLTNNGYDVVTISSNGNFGIGTASPAYLLDVTGSSRHGSNTSHNHYFTGSVNISGSLNATSSWAINALTASSLLSTGNVFLQGGNSFGATALIGTNDSHSFAFETSGSEKMRILTNGNVGIGTTSPIARLTVVTSGSSFETTNTMVAYFGKNTSIVGGGGSSFIRVSRLTNETTTGSNAEYTDIEHNSAYGSPFRYGTFGDTNIINGGAATNGVYGSINFVTSGSIRMTVAGGISASYVGIGTTSPVTFLDVVGFNGSYPTSSGTIQSTGSIVRLRNRDSNLVLDIGGNGGNGNWLQSTSRVDLSLGYPLLLNPNGGNVAIGTTSADIFSRGYGKVLGISGSSTAIEINASSGNAAYFDMGVAGTRIGALYTDSNGFEVGTPGAKPMYLFTNGSYKLTILSNGNVGIGTTVPGSKLQINDTTPTLTLRTDDGGVSRKAYIDFYTTFYNYPSDVGARRTSTISTGFSDGTWGTEFMAFHVGSGSANDSALLPIERVRINGSGNVGIGTISPISRLNVYASGSNTSVLKVEGSSGTLFEVTDNLSGSLFNVNTISGLPILEVFSDNTIIAGKYASNDFVITGSKVGIGTSIPTQKLEVQGNVQIGNDSITNVGLKITRLNGGIRTSEHTYHSSQNSPWYTYGQNLTWTNELAGTVESTQAYRPYFEGFAPVVGYKVFGFMNVTASSFTSANVINALVIKNDGNVGIGITNPTAKLAVTGSGTGQMLVGDAGFGSGDYTGISVNGTLNTTAYNILSSPTDTTLFINRPSGNDIRFRENNQNQMVLLTGGNLGIGTSTPGAKVEISGSSASSLFTVKSPVSSSIVFVSGSGNVGINTSSPAYTLQVNGSFGATTKSFVIDHPTKPGRKLVYGSLESPYHGIRLTGRNTIINGKCIVQLPDYINKLILHDSVNIQLTGIKCGKTLYIEDINIPENCFTVVYDKTMFETYKDYEFFWDFTATRADVPELITEL